MVGSDPRALAAEYALSRQARSEVKRPVWHCSLSCPPGKAMIGEQWDALTNDFMRMMGMEGHQFVAVRHKDTKLDHVHIIASRIRLDGELWHGRLEARKAINATRQLEREYGLTIMPGLEDIDVIDNKRNPTKREIEKADRTGEAPARLRLRYILDTALDEPGTIFSYMDRLEAVGVTVRPNGASTGRFNGFAFKGSQPGCQSASNSAPCGTEGQLRSRVVVAEERDRPAAQTGRRAWPDWRFEPLACLDQFWISDRL